MYPVTESFLEAIENEAVQHIRGRMTDITGTSFVITDSLTDNIRIESQCVEDAGCFNFGGMYIGTLECVLNLDSRKKDELIDGVIHLEFGIETSIGTEWIPLGVWIVIECTLQSSGRLKIKAMDTMKLLRAETEPEKLKMVTFTEVPTLMRHVTDLTGVKFAQTLDELKELTEWTFNWDIFGITYGKTAWAEVKSIAQVLGCFAFANREGKIEFRRLDNTTPVLTVTAEKRQNIQLEEYTYTVSGISYTNGNGFKTEMLYDTAAAVGSVLNFSDNVLIHNDDGNVQYYNFVLEKITPNIKNITFTPGEVSYYGNPALDVGDYIALTGGTAGDECIPFLICCNSWQFRGPQTLIASGISEAGTTGTSVSSTGGGSSSASVCNVNVVKSIGYVELSDFSGELYSELRTVASCGLACSAAAACFLECNLIVYSEEACTMQARIYVDSVLQTLQPAFSIGDAKHSTVHFSLNLSLAEGTHTVSIAVSGSGTISTSAYVWGQNIAAEQADSTDSSDYLYTIADGTATIDEYIGTSLHPAVPSKLEGANVTVIGKKAFIESEIISAAIPEGIVEIQ